MSNRVSIIVNGEPVDTYPNTVVASNFQLGDFGDIRSRNASHTNQFRLPKTANNNKVFGFADNVKSGTDIPYVKLPVKVVQNGLETIPEGTAFISSVKESYNISIYSDTFDFFEAIKGKLISEIDFGESMFTWNSATRATLVAASASPTSALHCAVIQYGQLDLTDSTFVADVTTTLPSVRYSKIVEKIIENAGYTFGGDIFDDEKYKNIIVPFSRDRFDFGGSFHKNREFKARRTTPQSIGSGGGTITYDTVDLQDDYGMFDATTGIFDCDIANTDHGDSRPFNFGLFAEVTFTVVSGTYRLAINEAGNVGFPSIVSANFTAGTHRVSIGYDDPTEATLIAEADANYSIELQAIVGGSAIVTSALFYNKSYGNNFLTNPQFFVQEILPDIDQTEFMRDFAIRFGVMFKERNKVLTCKRFTEMVSDKGNAKDWTGKRDISIQSELKFALSGYSQSNSFTYPSTDEEYKEGSGDGVLSVTNENIPTDSNFYTSLFNGTATKEQVNDGPQTIYVAHIPIWSTPPADIFTPFDSAPGFRLLLVRGKYSSEPTISFNGSGSSLYRIGYFIDPNTEYQCDWQQAINDNYSELEQSLAQAKICVNYYQLNEIDITGLDLLTPIFDDGAYYLVNKIENFVPGVSTKVELLKTV